MRVVYRKVAPFTDFGSVYHEFGHGFHGIMANPKDSVWKRYIIPMGVAETFSYLHEYFLDEPLYLKDELKLKDEAVKEITKRRKFMHLCFITFYSANSIMKMEYWRKGYDTEKAAKRWQELTKKFFIEVPGEYWLLHHIMPNYDLYAPSYIIAALRVSAIKERLREEYGARWWENKEATRIIRKLAEERGEFNIKEYKLNPERYLKTITNI